MNDRTRARDNFEIVVVEALMRLADLARQEARPAEQSIARTLGRAFALVDAWAHYRARLVLVEHVLSPLTRTLREMDAIVAHATKDDVEGWKPRQLPPIEGATFYRCACIRCEEPLVVEVQSKARIDASVMEAWAISIAKTVGWSAERADAIAVFRCARCRGL